MWKDYRIYVSYYSIYDDVMMQYMEFQSNYYRGFYAERLSTLLFIQLTRHADDIEFHTKYKTHATTINSGWVNLKFDY